MPPSPQGNPTADEPSFEGALSEELITISRWELEALQAKANGAQARVAAEPHVEKPAAVAVATEADGRAAKLERAYREAIRDRELATALAGRPLVPGAASQLIKLWREDFDVYESDGELKVTARDGRAVGKAVSDRLEEAEYAHFRPASSRGGVAAKGTGRTQHPDTPTVPRTLGEAALLQWREGAVGRADPASGPVGLRRR